MQISWRNFSESGKGLKGREIGSKNKKGTGAFLSHGDAVGRLVGFEPTTSRITIWRYYQLSYSRREISFYHFRPARLHISSTLFETSCGMRITSGQGRVKPSSGHFFVASTPIFDP